MTLGIVSSPVQEEPETMPSDDNQVVMRCVMR